MSSTIGTPAPSASSSTSASTPESTSMSTPAFTKPRDQLMGNDEEDEVSGAESESSSRSIIPEPKRPRQPKVKRPPFPFEYGKYRVRNMLPRLVLPRRLDPRCVAIESPTDLPLCWLGVPFSFGLVENYADNTGLGVPVTEGYHSRIPGSVDLMKTWLVITDNFYEDAGIHMDIRDVWGAEYPIITFISNRQTCDITMDQHQAIEDILEDMGVEKKDGPMWYLDRRELY